MSDPKRAVQYLAETVFRRQVVGLGAGSFALAKMANLADAWYSQRIQMERLIRGLGVDLVIDVGANRGQFATSIRRFYDGPILSFEPVSKAFDTLSSFSRRTRIGMSGRWRWVTARPR